MNVLLIDTGTTRKEYSEPIGIETIASYISNAIVDLSSVELYGYETVIAQISKKKYDIIGISAKIGSFDLVKKLIRYVENYSPETIICIGDIYGTYAYEEILKWNKNIICMIGEGEKNWPILVEVVKLYKKTYRDHLFAIKNIAYFFNGQIKINDRETIVDVNIARHPSRYLLKDILNKHGIAHLEASRGCLYGKCSFCGIVQKYGNSQWRPFPDEFIYEELIRLSDAGVVSPYFTDEDFFGNDINRVERIAKGIIDLKESGRINPQLNFYFNMRVDSVVGNGGVGYRRAREALSLLKSAGLREVFIGIESGSTGQIKRYRKNSEQMKSIKAIMTLNSLAIDVDIGFILFDPFMELSDLVANLDFILQAGITSNYSRLAKKLRVEPLTPYAIEKCNAVNISNSLDMDTVSFPYNFVDERIERIYKVFGKWEREDLDFIYDLQSFCRGEVSNEEERNKIKNIISMYRSLDLAFLRKLSECEIQGTIEKYQEVINYFADIRNQYDAAMMEIVMYYIEEYRK